MKVILIINAPNKLESKKEEHEISYFRIERPRKYVKKENIPIMAVYVPYEYLILYAENGSMFVYKYYRPIIDISVQRGKSFVLLNV